MAKFEHHRRDRLPDRHCGHLHGEGGAGEGSCRARSDRLRSRLMARSVSRTSSRRVRSPVPRPSSSQPIRMSRLKRFAGKPMVSVGVSKALSVEAAGKLIDRALAAKGDDTDAAAADVEDEVEEKESIGHIIYKHLMNGVSHMLVFVVAGGVSDRLFRSCGALRPSIRRRLTTTPLLRCSR